MNWYAGIGARKAPDTAIRQLGGIAVWMADRGWGLRTGGAEGADQAFMYGADHAGGEKQVFLPWNGFNELESEFCHVSAAALKIAEEHHHSWGKLSQGARKLMGRNSRQVLGPALDDPSNCVICWTPGGKGRGGTGQALRIAGHYEIPIFDLGREDQEEVWREIQLHVFEVERSGE